MVNHPNRNKEAKLDRRAEHLAEKFGLSVQLTTIWVRENPERSRRPMLPSDVKALKEWARA